MGIIPLMNSNWVGKTLGKVQIESLIARGGVAEVYLGTHVTLQRKVAVKILRNPSEEHSDALERFQREARVVANLRHPNIVQVFDFDLADNDPYLVMEYIQGPSLSKYLHFLHQKNERLKLPEVARMLNGVAGALEYAHRSGIIHRDIKPGNILLISTTTQIEIDRPLPEDFEPVLTDFGLVRFLDSSRQTTTGITAGTPAYMSPEQARGDTTDGRTDVYSLGIVLYEMLAGKLPFDGETTMGILLKHVNEPPAPIPGLPMVMQKILDRALAKSVIDRFQTPLEFARAFNAAVDINPATMQMESLASLGPSTMDLKSMSEAETFAPQKQPTRSKWIRLVVSGVAALAVGAVFFMNGFRSSSPPTETVTSTNSLAPTSSPTSTSTSTQTPIPAILGSTGVLRFENGNATADQVTLQAKLMPAPPEGYQYEVWLISGTMRISLGILSLDEAGNGELTYTDEKGTNLIANYNQMEITIEPNPDTSPKSTKLVAYAFTLPADGLTHVRNLLASFPNTPEKISLAQGFYGSMEKLDALAEVMQTAHENGDETLARQKAEAILNLIVGAQSPDHKDWDQDGFVADESDGYGLLLNGSNYGYLQAMFEEAEFTVNTPGASQQMLTHGEYLMVSVQNLAALTAQLQEKLADMLDTPAGSVTQKQMAEAVAVADQMLNGMDINSNGEVEPIPGEGGALTAYQQAYSMADMPLVRVGTFGNFTPTASISGSSTGTSTGGGSGGGGGTNPQPTKVPPGQIKTRKPPPTKKNGHTN